MLRMFLKANMSPIDCDSYVPHINATDGLKRADIKWTYDEDVLGSTYAERCIVAAYLLTITNI